MYYIFPLYFVIYNFLIFNNVKNSENYIFLKIFFKTFARKLCFINLLQICEKPFSIAICNEPFSVANLRGTVFRCKFAWKRFLSQICKGIASVFYLRARICDENVFIVIPLQIAICKGIAKVSSLATNLFFCSDRQMFFLEIHLLIMLVIFYQFISLSRIYVLSRI